ncbi:MAG: TonB-dependent receptor [Prevotella sp.]|nr:TonB-dependent receptor [Prevotella sp.]
MNNNMKTRLILLSAIAMVGTGAVAQTDSLQTEALEGWMTGLNPLQEVVVTGTRNAVDVRHLPYTVNVINRQTLTEQQQTNVLPTVMQQVPGLMVTSRSMMGYGVSTGAAGGISLRGLAGSAGQMLVLIDGHPQYNGVYGHPISDSYQTLMANRVEVLRGPASVLYGSNAMGGVMNIVTRRPVHRDFVTTNINVGAGSYGTFQAEASNQVRSGRFSSTIAAQYSRTDNHRPHTGFEQYGGYVKLGYDLNEHWNASVDLDLTHWNASNPGTVVQPKLENDQWITRGAASLTIENQYDRTSGALSIYDNFGRHKINDGYNAEGGTPQTDLFRSKDAVAGVSWYQSFVIGDQQSATHGRLTIGADYQHIYGRAYYTDRVTGAIVTTERRLMQSAHSHENEVAGYVDYRQDLTDWLTIDAGLRYDHHSTAGGEWVPQAGIVYRPVETGALKASVSKGFRNPNTREMYMYGTANHDSLRAERLWNYELSWRQQLGQFSYGANLYYIKGDNMIQTVAGKNINTGEIENYGVELEAQYRIDSHWSLSTNHSLLHMENPVVAAPTYKGFLGANFRQDKWSVIAGLQYLGGLYTAVGDVEQKENVCLLNATVNYALVRNVTFWIREENILTQKYEINLGYPMPIAAFLGGVNINL